MSQRITRTTKNLQVDIVSIGDGSKYKSESSSFPASVITCFNRSFVTYLSEKTFQKKALQGYKNWNIVKRNKLNLFYVNYNSFLEINIRKKM